MAFTVPNRPDSGIAADQAEPDKGDFQTLGYQKSGVLAGGATTHSSDNSVEVAAVSGYLNGEYFDITSSTPLSFSDPSGTGLSKFVLILIRKDSANSYSVYSHQGTSANNGESATNARYPDDVDYTTTMLLAAVYYSSGDTNISSSSIVDKRVFILPQTNPSVMATSPASGASATAGAIGEIKIDSSVTPGNGTSNVWVKTAASTWTNLGTAVTVSDGDPGDPATITVGGVTTGAAGSAAAVFNSNTPTTAILDFTIPRGDRGEDGDPGYTTSWNLQANSGASASIIADSVVNFTGGGGTTVSRSNNTITISSTTPTTPSYSYKVTAGVSNPQTTVSDGGLVSFIGGTGITVIQSGSAFTFNHTGTTPTYSFKVSDSIFGSQATISDGGLLVLYGGNDISVTRSSTSFTIDLTGSFLPLTAGIDHPITGYLHTGHLTPTSHATFNIGGSGQRYRTGYFSGVLYCGSVSESSDLALKEDIGTAPGLDLITSLKPLSYRFKNSPDKRHWGFGAQDVASVCDTDAGIVTDAGGMGLAYSEFTAPIVKAIQELSKRLEALENG